MSNSFILKITLKKLDNDAEISSTKNNYALVWMFDEEPNKYRDDYSSFVQYGKVSECLQLINCDQIKRVCAVVPNVCCDNNMRDNTIDPLGPSTWFVVSNRLFWLQYFSEVYILQNNI